MAEPKIKILAISNVYARCMHFEKKGDIEIGHCHNYDHGTLIAKGSVLVETLDKDESIKSSKEFVSPTFVFINKMQKHRITALEDDAVAVCIHALRDINENLIPPDSLIESKEFGSTKETNIETYLENTNGIKLKNLISNT